jgi:hypothetical protein
MDGTVDCDLDPLQSTESNNDDSSEADSEADTVAEGLVSLIDVVAALSV